MKDETKDLKDIDEGFVNLAMAIVEKAIYDYMKARRKIYHLEKLYGGVSVREDIERTYNTMRRITAFFHSDWYLVLCKYDGDYIIRMMDQEFRNWKREQINSKEEK